MKRVLVVLAVLGLVLAAVPAAAVVTTGSEHTTATDFLNATQLVGFDAEGTGDSATLVYTDVYEDYDFDDQTLGTNPPDGWEYVYTNGNADVDDTRSRSGSQSMYVSDPGGTGTLEVRPISQPYSSAVEDTVKVSMHGAGSENTPQLRFYENDNRRAIVGIQNGELSYYDGGWVTIDSNVGSNEWVDLEIQVDAANNEMTVTWDAEGGASGTTTIPTETAMTDGYDDVRVFSNGNNDGYVDDFRVFDDDHADPGTYLSDEHEVSNSVGGEVNVTEASGVSYDVTWEGTDDGGSTWDTLDTVTDQTGTGAISGSWDGSGYDQVRVEVTASPTVSSDYRLEIADESVQFESSAPELNNVQPADEADLDSEDVTLSADLADEDFSGAGDTVNVSFYWVNGTRIGSTEATSNQTVSETITDPDEGTYDWYVEATDSYGTTVSSNVRSFDVVRYPPDIFNNTMAPEGTLGSTEEDFTVDVDDQDFVNADEELNASLYIAGEYQGSDILTSPGTANVTAPIGFGGQVEYYWVVNDSHGYSTTSQNVTIQTPGSIEIREATGDHSLVTGASGELQFYTDVEDGPDQIYTRDADDGTVEMGDLPADENFIVVAEAENYTTRRVFITSIFDTATVYLPHENTTVVQPKFELQDFTGDFPGEQTVMEIQRNVEGDWRTVEGDRFSSINEFTSTLLFNERHRLVLTNVVTGEERDLGQFTPTESGSIVIRVSGEGASVDPQYEPAFSINPDSSSLPRSDNVTVSVSVDERNADLSGYDVTFESGGTEVATREVSGTDDAEFTLNLSEADGPSLNATVDWDGGTEERTWQLDGEYGSRQGLIGAVSDLGVGTTVGSLLTLVIMGLVIGFASPRLPPIAAAGAGVGVAVAGNFIGWLPIELMVVILAVFVVLALSEVRQ